MKKKILTGALAFGLVVPCVFAISACGNKEKLETWNGKVVAVSEAENNVISIETAEELAGLAKSVNEGNNYEGITIKLTRDMDLKNKEWTPIGYGTSNYLGVIESGKQFKGIFDGQNHVIKNLKITEFSLGGLTDATKSTGVGLFGQIYQAEVKNLKINNAKVHSNHFTGALVGFSVDSNISNCQVEKVTVESIFANDGEESGDKAGAVVGHFAQGTYTDSSATISNCNAKNSTVRADRDAGQVIGCLSNNATSTDNTAENVVVEWNESSSGKVEEGYNKANTNITQDIVGRIA